MNQELTLETVCNDLFEEWNTLEEHSWLGKMPQRTKEYFGNMHREFQLVDEDETVLNDMQNLVESKVFPLYERYRSAVEPIIRQSQARDWRVYTGVGAAIGVVVTVVGSALGHVPLVRTPFALVGGVIGGLVGGLFYDARVRADHKSVKQETRLFFEEVNRLSDAYELARDAGKIQDLRKDLNLNYART